MQELLMLRRLKVLLESFMPLHNAAPLADEANLVFCEDIEYAFRICVNVKLLFFHDIRQVGRIRKTRRRSPACPALLWGESYLSLNLAMFWKTS